MKIFGLRFADGIPYPKVPKVPKSSQKGLRAWVFGLETLRVKAPWTPNPQASFPESPC